MHVAVGRGRVATPSFGTVREIQGRTVMTERRVLKGRCQWAPTADLPLQSGDFLPLRSPAAFASAEQFGVFHATMFSAMAAQKNGEPKPEQHGCVREITTRLAQRVVGPK